MPTSPQEARAHYEAMPDSEKAAVAALVQQGNTAREAVRLVRSQSAQDAARAGVESDEALREPTFGERAAAFGQGAAETLGFNAADEVRGLATAVPRLVPGGESPVDAYVRGRDAQREASAAVSDAVPSAYGWGQLGGVAGSAGLGLAKAGATAASQAPRLVAAARGAAGGAAQGAASGFFGGEGAADSLIGAGKGALVGAALGSAPTLVRGGATEAAGKLRLALARSTPESQARALETIPVVGKPLGAVRRAASSGRPVPADYDAMVREQLREGPMETAPAGPPAPRLEPRAPPPPPAPSPPSPLQSQPFTPAATSSTANAPPVLTPATPARAAPTLPPERVPDVARMLAAGNAPEQIARATGLPLEAVQGVKPPAAPMGPMLERAPAPAAPAAPAAPKLEKAPVAGPASDVKLPDSELPPPKLIPPQAAAPAPTPAPTPAPQPAVMPQAPRMPRPPAVEGARSPQQELAAAKWKRAGSPQRSAEGPRGRQRAAAPFAEPLPAAAKPKWTEAEKAELMTMPLDEFDDVTAGRITLEQAREKLRTK